MNLTPILVMHIAVHRFAHGGSRPALRVDVNVIDVMP
jgi:hypothetical protein